MGVCPVARFDGQRPVIIQGLDDKLQTGFNWRCTNAKYRQNTPGLGLTIDAAFNR
jgi:hypothetical protein